MLSNKVPQKKAVPDEKVLNLRPDGTVTRQQVATLAQLAADRTFALTCSVEERLSTACELLIASGSRAVLVTDGSCCNILRGVLTEDDLLRAFVKGVSWECSLGHWLRAEPQRLLSMPSCTPVAEAAAKMANSVQTEDFALHYLLISPSPVLEPKPLHRLRRKSSPGGLNLHEVRLLSALDVARGLLEEKSLWGELGKAAAFSAALPVKKVMKPSSVVPVSQEECSLADAFRVLSNSRQHCVLVAKSSHTSGSAAEPGPWRLEGNCEAEAHGPQLLGIISASDVVRACSEGEKGSTSLHEWLLSLNSSIGLRVIDADASISHAACSMTCLGINHLLVVRPQTTRVIGVISALDIVCAISFFYAYMKEPIFSEAAEADTSPMLDTICRPNP